MVPLRTIGDRRVSAIGMGGARIALGSAIPDERSAVRTVQAALDAGITLLDTADVYSPDLGSGYSETAIGRAVRTWPGGADTILIATKGGKYWGRDGEVRIDGRPAVIAAACEASLRMLGIEAIDLYQLHEPDPNIPYEESVGALVDLQRAGKVKQIGISNADVELIRRALAIGRIASVQNRFSPDYRDVAAEIDLCDELEIAFLAWAPLGGLQASRPHDTVSGPFRRVADEHGVSPQQVALAWELTASPNVVPIPGATRPETILDSLRAVTLELTPADMEMLGGIAHRPVGLSNTY